MTTKIGETSLQTLLSTLSPTLHPQTFVFTSHTTDTLIPATVPIQMLFKEPNNTTTIITTLEAATAHNWEYTFPCKMITLDVHSSLEAVGFLAVVCTELKELGMGVNPVSGYYHDHLFVGVGREEEAVECLKGLAGRYKSAN